MAAKSQPDWVHRAISWGASVVIIGAMFKILHLGGPLANIIIGAGLVVEASLFFILGFYPPEPEPEWERVYPELSREFKGELPKSSARPASSAGNAAALDQMLADAKIGPELIESLGAGLRTFGDKVAAISNVADTSSATAELTDKIKAASAGFDHLGAAFDRATGQLRELGETSTDAKGYSAQVTNLTKNLSELNAVYELELQDASTHLKSMKSFYDSLATTMQNFGESMDDSKQFREEVGKLAKNLSSLNAIYGNMLSAMNQPRI